MTQTFDQQYTKARAAVEGGDWKLRAEIADLQAENAKLRYALAKIYQSHLGRNTEEEDIARAALEVTK